MEQLLNISSSPHVRSKLTTNKVMYQIIFSLMPVTVMGIINYRMGAVSVILSAVISAVAAEAVFDLIVKKKQTIFDGSAVVTGLMLALVLPPELPLYIPALGSIFAIIVVKSLFGGLGHNFLNPALAGRCFLLLSFGAMVTVYKIDGISTATPLAEMAAGQEISLLPMFLGNASGVIGSSVLGILIGAAYLLAVGGITIEIPAACIAGFCLFMGIFGKQGFHIHEILAHLMGGGMLLGAFFMATDPVTSPVTPLGRLIFGALIGILSGIFRVFGSASDSVSYAIIIANMFVPLIEEYTVPVPYGHRKTKEKKSFKIPKAAATLCVITLLAGAALSGVYALTKDAIAARKLEKKLASYRAVCPEAEEFSNDPALDEAIAALGGDVYGTEFGRVLINEAVVGRNAEGSAEGYIISVTSKDGFDGDIVLSVGLDSGGTVLGVEFTEISETAGMGMLCAEPKFKDQFKDKKVKQFVLNAAVGTMFAEEIDGISGATISSEAVTNAVNAALAFYAEHVNGGE